MACQATLAFVVETKLLVYNVFCDLGSNVFNFSMNEQELLRTNIAPHSVVKCSSRSGHIVLIFQMKK